MTNDPTTDRFGIEILGMKEAKTSKQKLIVLCRHLIWLDNAYEDAKSEIRLWIKELESASDTSPSKGARG